MTQQFVFANNAGTTLGAPVNTTQTTITLSSGAGSLFPSPTGSQQFAVSMLDALTRSVYEIMYCTSRTGDVLTVLRAQEGTTARSWLAGDFVNNYITAGTAANFAQGNNYSYAVNVQDFTATAGQTLFTLTSYSYIPGTNTLSVYVNGLKQILGESYTETSSTSFTFVNGLNVGANVQAIFGNVIPTAVSSASVGYNEGGTGAVTTTVQAKLQQTISVKDFGAKGDGTTDDTTAIQNAINYACSIKGKLIFPSANYVITSALTVTQPIDIDGCFSQIYQSTANASVFYFNGGGTSAGYIRNACTIKNFILGTAAGTGRAISIYQFMCSTFQDITIPYCYVGVQNVGGILNVFNNIKVGGTMPASPGFFVSTGVQSTVYQGFHFYAGAVSAANANTLIQCYSQDATRASYEFTGNNNNILINCDSEFSPSPTGYHIYAASEINLNVISGDYEGIAPMYFSQCTSPQVNGAFVNYQIEIASGTINALITGGLIKIITIDSGAINTTVDAVSLYTGASGVSDSGTNTRIGRVYNTQTSNAYAGREWNQTFTPVINVGGTPQTGSNITRAQGWAQQQGQFMFIEINMSWTTLSGSGALTVDCTSVLSNLTSRNSTLSIDLEKVTPGTNYGQIFAQANSTGFINIYKASTNGSGSAVVNLSDTGSNNYLFITGLVRVY